MTTMIQQYQGAKREHDDCAAWAALIGKKYNGCCPSGTTNCPIWPRRATLGDTMICGVRHPHPRTIAMKLETPASVAYANKLLARKASGWRLVEIRD